MYSYITIRSLIAGSIFALFCIGLGACHKSTDSPGQQAVAGSTVGQLLAGSFNVSLFNEALRYTGLGDSLNGGGPYTIFAPDDAAFHLIGIDSVSQIDKMNKDTLIHLLKYHILFGQKVARLSVDSKPDNPFENWDGKTLYLSRPYSGDAVNNDNFCVNGDTVVQADIMATNGVLHTLNTVLPYQTYATCADYLSADTNFSIFVAGLKKFNLYEQLKSAGPVTVLAPVNYAFNEVGIDEDSINRMDTTLISSLLFRIYLMTNLRYFSAPRLTPTYSFAYYSPDNTYEITYGGYYDPVYFNNYPGVTPMAFDPVTHDPMQLFAWNDGCEATAGFGQPFAQARIISQDTPAGNGVIVVIGETLAGPLACRRSY